MVIKNMVVSMWQY